MFNIYEKGEISLILYLEFKKEGIKVKKWSSKILTILLTLSFVMVPCVTSANAKTQLDKTIKVQFNDSTYANLPAEERGKAKLKDAGLPEKAVGHLSKEMLEEVADSQEIENSQSYFIEEFQLKMSPIDQDNSKMKQVNEQDFKIAVEEEKRRTANDGNQIMPLNDIGFEVDGPVTSMDNGKLIVNCAHTKLGSNHYLVFAAFQWVTMPNYRNTDYFSYVIKDSNYWSTDANTANAFYGYIKKTRSISKGASGWQYGPYNSSDIYVDIPSAKLKVPDGSLKGYYFDVDVLDDRTPILIWGNMTYTETKYYDLIGMFAMKGIVQTNKRIDTQAAYFHQTKSLIFSSASLTSAPSVGVSISPESKFSPCRREDNIQN